MGHREVFLSSNQSRLAAGMVGSFSELCERDSAGRALALVEPKGRMNGLDNGRHRAGSHQIFIEWN